MTEGIYLVKTDGSLVELQQKPYDSEALLQELLARYPNLLGNRKNVAIPMKWLLVKREMGIPDTQGGANRWALDHLFLDSEGVPTLVEVKRSTNTQIRREVVGQMLDYAANAISYWPVEKIQDEFRVSTEKRGGDPDKILQNFLGENQDVDAFWRTVESNLKTGKIRLIFVSDEIPRELRRIVEFLNEQMSPAEVLAVEIKQFVGDGVRSLVPRIIGETYVAEVRKKGDEISTEATFFRELANRSNQREYRVAKHLFDWAVGRGGRLWWGGSKDKSFFPLWDYAGETYYTFAARTGEKNAYIQIQFGGMRLPPFHTIEKRRELANRLFDAIGIRFTDEQLNRYPSVKMAVLGEKQVEAFTRVFDWYLEECEKEHHPG